MLKAREILSDATFRRSAVDWEDLNPYWKLEKTPHFSRWSTIFLLASFLNTLLTTDKRLTGQQFLAVDIFPAFLNTGTTDETFQQSGKQDSCCKKMVEGCLCQKFFPSYPTKCFWLTYDLNHFKARINRSLQFLSFYSQFSYVLFFFVFFFLLQFHVLP